ncbi:hypothetical protein BY458DRAFT_492433 [Sporodiniella umbellata]|nr:hypothetical protein BY458DRAFT_492433 [Sporodiniella umbellata]
MDYLSNYVFLNGAVFDVKMEAFDGKIYKRHSSHGYYTINSCIISAMGVVSIKIICIFVTTAIDIPSLCKISIKRHICSVVDFINIYLNLPIYCLQSVVTWDNFYIQMIPIVSLYLSFFFLSSERETTV